MADFILFYLAKALNIIGIIYKFYQSALFFCSFLPAASASGPLYAIIP